LCCVVQNDLVNTLTSLILKRNRGEVPAFDRLIIETSGLSEPSAIINSLYLDVSINQHYALCGIVTVIDNVEGRNVIDKFAEARKQLIYADVVIQTKLDLIKNPSDSIEPLVRKYTIAKIISNTVTDTILIDTLFATPYHPYKQHSVESTVSLHASGEIQSYSFLYDNAISWNALSKCLEAILSLKGQDIYRIKGIVNIVNEDQPYAIHGTQHVIYPPEPLALSPGFPAQSSKLVFIVKNTPKALLKAMLDLAFQSDAANQSNYEVTTARNNA
jgi:G3E family GTPase